MWEGSGSDHLARRMLIWNQGPPSFPAAGKKPFCTGESWVLDRIPLLSSWVNMDRPPNFSEIQCP